MVKKLKNDSGPTQPNVCPNCRKCHGGQCRNVCYNCGDPSHKRKDCPKPEVAEQSEKIVPAAKQAGSKKNQGPRAKKFKNDGSPSQRKLCLWCKKIHDGKCWKTMKVCFNCGDPSHKRVDCPKLSRQKSRIQRKEHENANQNFMTNSNQQQQNQSEGNQNQSQNQGLGTQQAQASRVFAITQQDTDASDEIIKDPTLETEIPTLIVGRIPALNRSADKNICPSGPVGFIDSAIEVVAVEPIGSSVAPLHGETSNYMATTGQNEYATFEEKMRKTVYLDNLSPEVTIPVLRTALGQFGIVTNVQFIPNYMESRDIPQCALVEMETSKQAKSIITDMSMYPFMMSGLPRCVRARAAEPEMFGDRPVRPGRKIHCQWIEPTDPDFMVAKKLKQLTRKHAAEASFLLKLQLDEEEKLAKQQGEQLKGEYKKLDMIESVVVDGSVNKLARHYQINITDEY
ncbi:uncharacterized protein LOC143888344 isoform X2 [Tasmannia lanceolata]|uniref:uncharacterized protein LOC143888344 isoform X2 n=1 Tax=Tasmannia lanceolata TaxID=3420 RepID=UPI004062ED6C